MDTHTQRNNKNQRLLAAFLTGSTLLFSACTIPRDTPPETETTTQQPRDNRDISAHPEIATGYRSGMSAVENKKFAVATANPLATTAAYNILDKGGTAADALVAAQAVLGLVEPQSSGIGGGGYILYNNADSNQLIAIDGRETAPASATETYLTQLSPEDPTPVLPDARRSGRSIGTPGILAALDSLHQRFGTTDWKELFTDATTLAIEGFRISPRMASAIEDAADDLATDTEAKKYLLDEQGQPKTSGTLLTNPDYAHTLETIAQGGAAAFYHGDIARAIVDKTASTESNKTPGQLSLEDLANYTPQEYSALCGDYREKIICSMPPSSSGGVTLLSALGILNNFPLEDLGATILGKGEQKDGAFPSPEAVHLISEAERLAYADRDAYIADPTFVPQPNSQVEDLIDSQYLAQRSQLIDMNTSMGKAQPGKFEMNFAQGGDLPEHGTSHISIIDSYGNAASMTTSVEAAFGSFHMTKGFFLNNQLTDFSEDPVEETAEGTVPVANRVEGGKRPRSSMAPVLVFDRADKTDDSAQGKENNRGTLRMVVGSPGGSTIPQYVLRTLVALIDWGMDPQQAISSPNFGARNTEETGIGGEHPLLNTAAGKALVEELKKRGHEVITKDQSSGLSVVVVREDGVLVGGVDPRREGEVMGR